MNRVRLTDDGGHVVVDHDQRVCGRCVLPETFPDIEFDGDGVCSYCRDEAERLHHSKDMVRDILQRTVEGAGAERSYDCLLLFSGGKDSSLALLRLVREYGLRVLAFTLDNGFLAKVTADNMRRVLDATGADHLVLRPHQGLMHGVYRTALSTSFGPDTTKYSTAACGSCIGLVLSAGMRTAAAYGIPLLAGGWTPGQFTTSAFVTASFLREVADRNLDPVKLASPELIHGLDTWQAPSAAGPAGLVNPLYADDYTEEQALTELKECGWLPPQDTDSCSTNCRLNGLLIVDHLQRHGYHPYVYELAHHVRLGAMTRPDALEKLRRLKVRPDAVGAVAVELGIPSPVRTG